MLDASRRRLLTACSLCWAGVGAGVAGGALAEGPASAATGAAAPAAEVLQTEEIRLQRIDAKGAVTIVRAMAGIRDVEIVDGQTIRIQSSPEKVLLARKVLELAEASEGGEPEVAKYEVGDGTHVAAVALQHAAGHELMVSLRTLGIRSMAFVDSPPIVLVRDSAEQVQAALQLILAWDHAAP